MSVREIIKTQLLGSRHGGTRIQSNEVGRAQGTAVSHVPPSTAQTVQGAPGTVIRHQPSNGSGSVPGGGRVLHEFAGEANTRVRVLDAGPVSEVRIQADPAPVVEPPPPPPIELSDLDLATDAVRRLLELSDNVNELVGNLTPAERAVLAERTGVSHLAAPATEPPPATPTETAPASTEG